MERTLYDTVCALYQWLIAEAPTLKKHLRSGKPLTPRLEVFGYANGTSYDVIVRFFDEYPVTIPIQMLPKDHVEFLANLVESDDRTIGFASVQPARPGSAVLIFRHFVWDEYIRLQS